MTTTSFLPHAAAAPPLTARNPVYLRTNYYGSVGRPCNGKRKSAVELLQESKAYYVKSESVLDTKQEFKTSDHLRVRSPTVDSLAQSGSVGNGSSYAFAVCPICSPYHYHQCHPYATTSSVASRAARCFGQFELDALEKHYLAHYAQHQQHQQHQHSERHHHHSRSRKENRENGGANAANGDCSVVVGVGDWSLRPIRINRSQERRSSVPTCSSANSFPSFYLKPLQIQKDILTAANSSGGSSTKSSVGMHSAHQDTSLPSASSKSSSFSTSASPQQRHSSLSSTSTSSRRRRAAGTGTHTVATSTSADKVQMQAVPQVPSSAPPILTTVSSSPHSHSNHGTLRERKDDVIRDSPPPLPPKSPRTCKPMRPNDFPQRLTAPGNPPEALPPPPPRRTTSSSEYQQPEVLHAAKYKRPTMTATTTTTTTAQPEKSAASAGVGQRKRGEFDGIPITLLSPILVPTPPLDITMESPMSDSFPIISPPPAFSTPVTPMLDRQNSTPAAASDNASIAPKIPLAATTSGVSSSGSGKSRKSTPTDVSMTYASPRSPVDLDISPKNSTIETEPSESIETTNTNEEDSFMDCRVGVVEKVSSAESSPTPGPKSILSSKKSGIPKSVTENALYSVCNKFDGAPPVPPSQNRQTAAAIAQQSMNNQANVNSNLNANIPKLNEHLPHRPILRSKSDLSHRYKKAASSFNLIGGLGFTLVHVDLGLNGSPLPPIRILPASCHPQLHQQHAQQQLHPAAFRTTSATSTSTSTATQIEHQDATVTAPRSSAELERFFDMLGLDNMSLSEANNQADNNGKRSGGSSPVFFSSVSSIESEPRRGGSVDSGDSPIAPPKVIGARTVGGSGGDYATTASILPSGNNLSNGVSAGVGLSGVSGVGMSMSGSSSLFIQHGEPSIVERNARVIKWLYNCRKAVEMSKR